MLFVTFKCLFQAKLRDFKASGKNEAAEKEHDKNPRKATTKKKGRQIIPLLGLQE
jgi:hypothetical protein